MTFKFSHVATFGLLIGALVPETGISAPSEAKCPPGVPLCDDTPSAAVEKAPKAKFKAEVMKKNELPSGKKAKSNPSLEPLTIYMADKPVFGPDSIEFIEAAPGNGVVSAKNQGSLTVYEFGKDTLDNCKPSPRIHSKLVPMLPPLKAMCFDSWEGESDKGQAVSVGSFGKTLSEVIVEETASRDDHLEKFDDRAIFEKNLRSPEARKAYARMIRCLDPCVSENDARFLTSCEASMCTEAEIAAGLKAGKFLGWETDKDGKCKADPKAVQPKVLEVVRVSSRGKPAFSKLKLEKGKPYQVRVKGYVLSKDEPVVMADAEYAFGEDQKLMNDPKHGVKGSRCADKFKDWRDDAGLVIDQEHGKNHKSPYWGPYNPSHEYKVEYTGKGQAIQLHYNDCKQEDNNGFFEVEVLGYP